MLKIRCGPSGTPACGGKVICMGTCRSSTAEAVTTCCTGVVECCCCCCNVVPVEGCVCCWGCDGCCDCACACCCCCDCCWGCVCGTVFPADGCTKWFPTLAVNNNDLYIQNASPLLNILYKTSNSSEPLCIHYILLKKSLMIMFDLYQNIPLLTDTALCVLIWGTCGSGGSGFKSTALLAISFASHICLSSCRTCSSTPSSINDSRTPAITSSITVLYNFSCKIYIGFSFLILQKY